MYNTFTMDEILKKLIEHDKRFDRQYERFDRQDERSNRLESQIELLAQTAVEHTARFDRMEATLENMATKDDISRVMNTLDAFVGLYKKKDEEVMVLARNVKQLNDKVESHDKDIKLMKPALGLS